MRRSGIAAGVVIGSALLASLFVWGCGCASKMEPAAGKAARSDSGGATTPPFEKIQTQNYERTERGRDPMDAERLETAQPKAKPEFIGRPGPADEIDGVARGQEDAISVIDSRGEPDKKIKYKKEPAESEIPGIPPEGAGEVGAKRRPSDERSRSIVRQYSVGGGAAGHDVRSKAGARRSQVRRCAPVTIETGGGEVRRAGSWQTNLATDELWVIERPDAGSNQPAATDADTPTRRRRASFARR